MIIELLIAGVAYFGLSIWSRPQWYLWWWARGRFKQKFKAYYGKINEKQFALGELVVSPSSHLVAALCLQKVSQLPVQFVAPGRYPAWVLWLIGRAKLKAVSAENFSVNRQYLNLIPEAMLSNGYLPVHILHVCGLEQGLVVQRLFLRRPLYVHAVPVAEEDVVKLRQQLRLESVEAWSQYTDYLQPLAESWLETTKRGGGRLAVADSTGAVLSYTRMLVGVLCLRKYLLPKLKEESAVGICLPPSVAGATVMMTVACMGKTLVNLNYTASEAALRGAVEDAGIQVILTSKRFEQNLEKKGFFVKEVFHACQVVYLEDLRPSITAKDKITYLLFAKLMPVSWLKKRFLTPVALDDTLVILFSSGSEGRPKGVVLSHRNAVTNAKQAGAALEVKADDVLMGVLPIFHAFGLTVTTLLPLLEGIPVISHPDPRDGVAIGHMVQQYQATIMCGTSTFFRLYARSRGLKKSHFQSLRVVVAGAEKLLPEVRQLFLEKFGKEILEGYGTTELSPVAAANVPESADGLLRNKVGTIGRPVPGCAVKILDPETQEELPLGEAGMITYGGPNVMMEYLYNPEKTAGVIIEANRSRWYMTGDKGKVDEEGFVTILDRYSRFAKLGGEMVSLGAIEATINRQVSDEDVEILAVAIPDSRKGEVVVLLYTAPGWGQEKMKAAVVASGLSNLMRPQYYLAVEQIPKLGTGKTDFSAAKKLALDAFAQARAVETLSD